MLIIWEIVLA